MSWSHLHPRHISQFYLWVMHLTTLLNEIWRRSNRKMSQTLLWRERKLWICILCTRLVLLADLWSSSPKTDTVKIDANSRAAVITKLKAIRTIVYIIGVESARTIFNTMPITIPAMCVKDVSGHLLNYHLWWALKLTCDRREREVAWWAIYDDSTKVTRTCRIFLVIGGFLYLFLYLFLFHILVLVHAGRWLAFV